MADDYLSRTSYRHRPPGVRRLLIVTVLIMSMILTLLGRLYYVQLLDKNKPVQTAGLLHDGVVVIPAPRGEIVDATGLPLVTNTAVQEVTVDREVLLGLPHEGAAVLARLAKLLGTTATSLATRITPCSPTVHQPCWVGQPYQPVPVATKVTAKVVLAIGERREDFPGVTVQTLTQPHYPYGSLAAHLLGYTGQITTADQKADPKLNDADTIGRAGLEEQYDSVLRGVDGQEQLRLDPQGYAVGNGQSVAPVQGDTLVTSIDYKIQSLADKALKAEILNRRQAGLPATGGAVVVMDPQNGRIIAAASYPTYDPQEFVGGISEAQYAKLISPSSDDPLISRAIAGQYAPGSTFKLVTASSLLMHHEITEHGIYDCPGSVTIDGRVKTNYDSEVLGPIDLENALGYSCDTFFYVPEANEYYRDQARVAKGEKPHEWLQHMASDFGVGRIPNVDLPANEQGTGSYADRETRLARWKKYQPLYCAEAKKGYPNVRPASQRAYLTLLASQNCTDGWRYRAGDNADMAIGQGETTMSPLQLAVAYSALVNGGKIWNPKIGWQVVDAHGKVVKTITPTVHNRVPVKQQYLNYIAKSLDFSRGWAVSGAFAYIGSNYQNRIGGKTGTAQVEGKQDTSWLASWGPISHTRSGAVRAKFVMVGMIEQSGTGATAAGPLLKRLWDAIMGANGKPIVANSAPIATPPRIKATVTHSSPASGSGK